MGDSSIRLLAVDLDSTLLDAQKRVPVELREALDRFVTKGGLISTASGRFHTTQERFLVDSDLGPERGYPHFLVSVDKLIHRLECDAYVPLSEWNDPILARWRTMAREIDTLMPALREALAEHGLAGEDLFTADELLRAAWMTLAFDDTDTAVRAGEIMMEVLGHIDGIRPERNTRFAGVTMTETGKGYALAHVAELAGVSSERVLAIGDSCNDLTMLDGRFGFRSGAVGNAEPAVKDAVRRAGGVVSESEGPEGVLEILTALKV